MLFLTLCSSWRPLNSHLMMQYRTTLQKMMCFYLDVVFNSFRRQGCLLLCVSHSQPMAEKGHRQRSVLAKDLSRKGEPRRDLQEEKAQELGLTVSPDSRVRLSPRRGLSMMGIWKELSLQRLDGCLGLCCALKRRHTQKSLRKNQI